MIKMMLVKVSFGDISSFGYVRFAAWSIAAFSLSPCPLSIQTFRAIYTGKSSALDGKRTASASSLAEKNGMKAASPETVAYAALQVSPWLTFIVVLILSTGVFWVVEPWAMVRSGKWLLQLRKVFWQLCPAPWRLPWPLGHWYAGIYYTVCALLMQEDFPLSCFKGNSILKSSACKSKGSTNWKWGRREWRWYSFDSATTHGKPTQPRRRVCSDAERSSE